MPEKTTATGWTSAGRLSAAERYRAKSAQMGADLTRAVVELADVQPGMQVLDLASGTGEPAISLAAKLQGSGEVVGSDINPEVLAIARARAAERGLTNLTFEIADAQSLPFADGSFDVATSRFGVMFFGDVVQALTEVRRVLRPSGRIALAAWGPFAQPYFDATAGVILRHLPDPTFQPPIMFRFSTPGSLRGVLAQAGFGDVMEETRTVRWSWDGSAEEVWDYFREVTAPLRPLFARITPDVEPAITRDIVSAIEHCRRGDRLEFDARIVFATAVRH